MNGFSDPPQENLASEEEVRDYVSELLDAKTDWFDTALNKMRAMNAAKRRDYAVDGSPFSNFEDNAENMGLVGYTRLHACRSLIYTKIARLKSLQANGRLDDVTNESVVDTYFDLAVYATILFSMVLQDNDKKEDQS